jgi:hypothetical protein
MAQAYPWAWQGRTQNSIGPGWGRQGPATPAGRLLKRRMVLAFLSLGCSSSATWRLGNYTFSIIVLKIFFSVELMFRVLMVKILLFVWLILFFVYLILK